MFKKPVPKKKAVKKAMKAVKSSYGLDNAKTPKGFKNTNNISANSKQILSARKKK